MQQNKYFCCKGGLKMRKEQLEQYRELCLEIKELEDEKESLSELASSWTISPRRIQGTASDVTANLADKLLQLAEIIAKRINELVLMRIEVEKFIDKLPIQDSLFLRLYYVRGLTWEQTAEKMGYTVRHVMRMRSKILNKYCEKSEEFNKTPIFSYSLSDLNGTQELCHNI